MTLRNNNPKKDDLEKLVKLSEQAIIKIKDTSKQLAPIRKISWY